VPELSPLFLLGAVQGLLSIPSCPKACYPGARQKTVSTTYSSFSSSSTRSLTEKYWKLTAVQILNLTRQICTEV